MSGSLLIKSQRHFAIFQKSSRYLLILIGDQLLVFESRKVSAMKAVWLIGVVALQGLPVNASAF